MTPETFCDLLDRATDEAPPAPPSAYVVRSGRARLRRRRLALAAATTAAVLVLGSVATVLPHRGPERGHDVADELSGAQLLDRCVQGAGATASAALEASGPSVLVTSVRTDLKVMAAVSSADGALWGACGVWLQPQAAGEQHASMEVFDATRRSSGPAGGWSVGTGCGVPETQQHGCDRWAVSGVGKLPPEVAAVRIDLGDGTSATLPTVDGFFVLNVLHPLPSGGTVRHDGTVAGFEWGRQLTYLAADGSPLAAARLDSPRYFDVPGIPPLRTVKSLGQPWDGRRGPVPSASVQP